MICSAQPARTVAEQPQHQTDKQVVPYDKDKHVMGVMQPPRISRSLVLSLQPPPSTDANATTALDPRTSRIPIQTHRRHPSYSVELLTRPLPTIYPPEQMQLVVYTPPWWHGLQLAPGQSMAKRTTKHAIHAPHVPIESSDDSAKESDTQNMDEPPPSVPMKERRRHQRHVRAHSEGLPPKPRAPEVKALPTLPHHPAINKASRPAVTDQALAAFKATRNQTPLERLQQLLVEAKREQCASIQMYHALTILEEVEEVAAGENEAEHALVRGACKLVRRLASRGHTDAQYQLAEWHRTGAYDHPVDETKAFHLYLQGAKHHHADCMYRLAVCYEHGQGARADPKRAVQCYRKAAQWGVPDAMVRLGMILLKGQLGHAHHPCEGLAWLKRTVSPNGEALAEVWYELGVACDGEANARATKHVPDPVYARELITKAAEQGHAQAQYRLGLAYEQGDSLVAGEVSPVKSIEWYCKAADQEHAAAELALASWYLTGVPGLLKRDTRIAFRYAFHAAERGSSAAMYAVGYLFEIGEGVTQDLQEAKLWYRQAAAHHHHGARRRLEQLHSQEHAEAHPSQRCHIM